MPRKRIVVASVVAGGLVLTGIAGASFADARSRGHSHGHGRSNGSWYNNYWGGGNNNPTPSTPTPAPAPGGTTTPSGPLTLCSNAGNVYAVSGSCPSGYTQVTTASLKGDKGDKGDPGAAGNAGTPGDNRIKVVHKTVTLNADFTAATSDPGCALNFGGPEANETCKKITLTGLPAYNPDLATTMEVFSTNADSNPFPTVTDVAVQPVSGPAGTTVPGSTKREFYVDAAGFTGSRTFTLDVWVLSTTG